MCETSFRLCKEGKNHVLLYGFVPLELPLSNSNSYSKVKGHCYCYVNSQVRAPRSGAAEQRENFFGEVRPAGRVPFCVTRKEPKSDWGPLPVSAFAERALTVIAPRPPVTGDALQRVWL